MDIDRFGLISNPCRANCFHNVDVRVRPAVPDRASVLEPDGQTGVPFGIDDHAVSNRVAEQSPYDTQVFIVRSRDECLPLHEHSNCSGRYPGSTVSTMSRNRHGFVFEKLSCPYDAKKRHEEWRPAFRNFQKAGLINCPRFGNPIATDPTRTRAEGRDCIWIPKLQHVGGRALGVRLSFESSGSFHPNRGRYL